MDSGTFEAIVRNVDEIDRLLAETEGELAKLNARRTELLAQITALQQEKASFLQMIARIASFCLSRTMLCETISWAWIPKPVQDATIRLASIPCC